MFAVEISHVGFDLGSEALEHPCRINARGNGALTLELVDQGCDFRFSKEIVTDRADSRVKR